MLSGKRYSYAPTDVIPAEAHCCPGKRRLALPTQVVPAKAGIHPNSSLLLIGPRLPRRWRAKGIREGLLISSSRRGRHVVEWLRRWPIGTFPLLVDDDRNLVETSIIIEYLQLQHPGPVRLIHEDSMRALDVRFLDLHIMHWVQHAVGAALTGDATKREEAHALARQPLGAPDRD